MSKDAQDSVGMKIGPQYTRDAVHVATIALEVTHDMAPGTHVGIVNNKATPFADKLVGIVDPFLKEDAETGDFVWIMLYPRTITSLNHNWEHPDIPSHQEIVDQVRERLLCTKEDAEKWIRDWLDSTNGPSFETVIASVIQGNMWDEYLSVYGEDANGSIPDEFWDKVEIYTGKKYTGSQRAKYFSCSC